MRKKDNFMANSSLKLRPKLRKALILALILLVYLLFRPAPSMQKQDQNYRYIRGVWLTNIATAFFHHTTLLDNVFHHISRSDYNRIYLSTYGIIGTIYPSKQIKSHPLFVPPFTDPLNAAQLEAKRQGLKLYAWLEYGLMLPLQSEIARQHPDWLLKTSTGETIVNDFVWLNPEHPQVQSYILNLITEVSQYSNLEGIQLDDHWAVPKQFGNKTQALTRLTAKVHQHLTALNPKMILSLSPNPYHFSLNHYNQDWLTWVNQGYIDEVVLQVYRPTAAQFKSAIASSSIEEISDSVPVAIGIYAGSLNQLASPKQIKEQIEISQQLGYGFSIFCWEYRILGSFLAPH